MPHSRDYIPSREAIFFSWQNSFRGYFASHCSEWTVPKSLVEALHDQSAKYNYLYEEYQDPAKRTVVLLGDKKAAREELIKTLRQVIQFLQSSPLVSDHDRLSLEIPIRKTSRTPVPVPVSHPILDRINKNEPGFISFFFTDEGDKKPEMKPEKVAYTELRYSFEEGEDPEAFPQMMLATKDPVVIDFKYPNRGKKIWFSARWVNARMQKGPWSPIAVEIVP